jgi:hypothetical protein
MAKEIIFITIIAIFLATGLIMPYLNATFPNESVNAGNFVAHKVTGEEIFMSVLSMPFWSFGILPLWLDSVFIVFRVIFGIMIYQYIRGN